MNSTIQMKPILKKFFLGIFAFPLLLFIMSILLSLLDYVYISYIGKYVNRKALFIFCNAILLFIVRDSGLLLVYSTNKQQGKAMIRTNIRDYSRLRKDDVEVKTSAVVEEKTKIDQTVEDIEELEVVNVQPLLHNPNPIIHNKKIIEENEEVNELYGSAAIVSKEERSKFKSGVEGKALVHFTLSKSAPGALLYSQNVESTNMMEEELEVDEYNRSDDIILQKPDSSCVLNVGINEEMIGDMEVDHDFNRRCDEFITKVKRELSGKGTMEAV